MKRLLLYCCGWQILWQILWLILCLPFAACTRGVQPSGAGASAVADTAVVVYAPVAVKKKVSKRVFAHLMPWFETKTSNQPAGAWGQHWTMANQDPDIVDANGRRQIASYYYPMIGPYASGDTNVIDYQLLLMKLSGIDGVLIDWPGTVNLYDYPRNAANAETIVSQLAKTGLHYAMVYEDQNINIAYGKGVVTDKIAAARRDMEYLQAHHFGSAGYEKINGEPLLLVFGPQTFTSGADWQSIFSVVSGPVAFFTLWGDSGEAGSAAAGEFAWINADNLASLTGFYSNSYAGAKIASAYPGFNPFYARGGWPGPAFVIAAKGEGNFQTTLGLALQSPATYIQLPTWNDYGEGTMIEPTVEFGYGLLSSLQTALGVNEDSTALVLADRFYRARISHSGNAPVQRELDQVFYYLVSLQAGKAADLLNSIN